MHHLIKPWYFILKVKYCGYVWNSKCNVSGSRYCENAHFSVISWPILILFVLSDRAWCGLQNFYTEFWNSLIMQIYANLFKINEKCYFSVIFWPILILFVLSDRAWCGLQNFYTELWNSLIMQIYANLFKINEKCYFSVISWPILIPFVLSDRAWCGLQNFYTELWNSLIMQIYAHLFKVNEKCHLSSILKSQQICTWGGDIYYTSRNLLSTCLFRYIGMFLRQSQDNLKASKPGPVRVKKFVLSCWNVDQEEWTCVECIKNVDRVKCSC